MGEVTRFKTTNTEEKKKKILNIQPKRTDSHLQ